MLSLLGFLLMIDRKVAVIIFEITLISCVLGGHSTNFCFLIKQDFIVRFIQFQIVY